MNETDESDQDSVKRQVLCTIGQIDLVRHISGRRDKEELIKRHQERLKQDLKHLDLDAAIEVIWTLQERYADKK